jgi:hypothetical protein
MAFCVCWWCRLATGARFIARACCTATACLRGCGRRAESGGPAPGLPSGRYRRGTGPLARPGSSGAAYRTSLWGALWTTAPLLQFGLGPKELAGYVLCTPTVLRRTRYGQARPGALLPTSFTSHASDHRPTRIGMWSLPACGNLRDSLGGFGVCGFVDNAAREGPLGADGSATYRHVA